MEKNPFWIQLQIDRNHYILQGKLFNNSTICAEEMLQVLPVRRTKTPTNEALHRWPQIAEEAVLWGHN